MRLKIPLPKVKYVTVGAPEHDQRREPCQRMERSGIPATEWRHGLTSAVNSSKATFGLGYRPPALITIAPAPVLYAIANKQQSLLASGRKCRSGNDRVVTFGAKGVALPPFLNRLKL